MPTLSIIVLSYDTKELTLSCLRSILKQYSAQCEAKEYEIIVVDNASHDNSVAAIKKLKNPAITVFENKENVGFAKGCNIAARQAQGTYLFFLNSDTEVSDNGITKMIDFLNIHADVNILGGKLINTDGFQEKSAGKFYDLFRVFLMLLGSERLGIVRFAPKTTRQVDWVSGGSMMIRKDIFEKNRGFDERFFMYMEDMELCFRVAKEGAKTFFFNDVSIVHKSYGSSNRAFAVVSIFKGLLYHYQKHANLIQYSIVRLMLAAKAIVAIAIGTITANSYLTTTYKKALGFV